MTCIIGLKHKGRVYVGGDSAGVGGGYEMKTTRERKVFRNGEAIIGYTSSFRMGQLLQYHLVLPKHPSDMNTETYMRTLFIDAVRSALKDGGYASKHNEQERIGTFLVAYRGRLFRVEDDLNVFEARDNYISCGCGDMYADGSLYTSANRSDPKERVLLALRAAAHMSAGVRGPFYVLDEPSRSKKRA